MPENAANILLDLLVKKGAMAGPYLPHFRHSVTSLGLPDKHATTEWLSYLSSYRCLHSLDLSQCGRVRDTGLGLLSPLSTCLKKLSLRGCTGLVAPGAPIAQLTGLTSLDLSDSQVRPEVVSHLGGLHDLVSLDLGGIPVTTKQLSALSHLTQLTHLSLWGTSVTDSIYPWLDELPGLLCLNLSWSLVTSLPMLPPLEVLRLSHCQLEHVWWSVKAGVRGLKQLHLQHSKLGSKEVTDGLNALLRCSAASLSVLNLSNVAEAVHCYPTLAVCSHLTQLDLHKTPTQNEECEHLLLLERMEELDLGETYVGTPGLGMLMNMTKLQVLRLTSCHITDEGLNWLMRLTSLTSLDLSHNDITGVLTRAVPHVEEANMDHVMQNIWRPEELDDGGRSGLRGASGSSGGAVVSPSDEVQNCWGCFPNLSVLKLVRTGVTNSACRDIGHGLASSLRELSLGSPAVSDSGIRSLRHLRQLEALLLERCPQVTSGGLQGLQGMERLREVRVEGCWLVQEEVARMLPRVDVWLEGQLLVGWRKGKHQGGTSQAHKVPENKGRGSTSREKGMDPHEGLDPGQKEELLRLYDDRYRYELVELIRFRSSPLVGCDAQGQLFADALWEALDPEIRARRDTWRTA